MKITYKTKHLQKCAENKSYGNKHLGSVQMEKYQRRLGDLEAAETLEDTRNLPGHYHELTGNRKGEWATSLDGQNRLIFIPHESPIPTDNDGKYIWIEIKGIEIKEIVDYHREKD